MLKKKLRKLELRLLATSLTTLETIYNFVHQKLIAGPYVRIINAGIRRTYKLRDMVYTREEIADMNRRYEDYLNSITEVGENERSGQEIIKTSA